jgi:hypothetical protein
MNVKKACYLSFLSVLLIQCGTESQKSAKGRLTISYQLRAADSLVPSFQTAIWLEDLEGNYLKSVLVSEYLSYGGYNDTTICTNWIKKAGWDSVSLETFDAVTVATPPVGENSLEIDCRTANLAVGRYRFCVQTHIIEEYNIMCSGVIDIGDMESERRGEPEYLPARHPDADRVLENVKATYKP